MIWRRVLVPASVSLSGLRGILQVSTGWEGVHLIHAVHYGPVEFSTGIPDTAVSRTKGAGERHVRVRSGKHERHGGEDDDRGIDEHALQGDDVGVDAERVPRRENGQAGGEQVDAKQADRRQGKAPSGDARQGESEQNDGRQRGTRRSANRCAGAGRSPPGAGSRRSRRRPRPSATRRRRGRAAKPCAARGRRPGQGRNRRIGKGRGARSGVLDGVRQRWLRLSIIARWQRGAVLLRM